MPCSIKHIVRCETFILQNIGEGRAVSGINYFQKTDEPPEKESPQYRFAKKVLEITKQLVGVNVFKTNDIVREIKLLSVNESFSSRTQLNIHEAANKIDCFKLNTIL